MAKKKKSKGAGKSIAIDIDVKQFLLLHGEQIALWLAVGVMALMIVVGLVMKGAHAGSAQATADRITALGKQAQATLASSNPTEDAAKSPAKVLNAADVEPIDPTPLALATPFFDAAIPEDLKWRQPKVLVPDEFDVSIARVQVPSYFFDRDMEHIFVRVPSDRTIKIDPKISQALKDSASTFKNRYTKSTRNATLQQQYLEWMRSRTNQPSQYVPKFGTVPAPKPPDPKLSVDLGHDAGDKYDLVAMDVAKLGTVAGEPAKFIQPYVMAVVSGSFPYKQQLENFRRALHYSSVQEMLRDKAKDPSVEFAGFHVERRTLSLDGKEEQGWTPLDIDTPYKHMRYITVEVQPEDPEWVKYGLVVMQIPATKIVQRLPRPATITASQGQVAGGGQAPGQAAAVTEDVYSQPKLVKLEDALTAARNKGLVAQAPVKESKLPDMDKYDPDKEDVASLLTGRASARPAAGGTPQGGGQQQADEPDSDSPRGGRRQPSVGPNSAAAMSLKAGNEVLLPDHCLFRFLDMTVKPGHLYDYRVQIRMANPNYRKPQLAISEKLTTSPELTSDWVEVARKGPDGKDAPLHVRVPPDSEFYAVNELPDETTRAISISSPYDRLPPTAQRTPVQIHRWVRTAFINPAEPSTDVNLGEWSVVQRTLAYRGEQIGGMRNMLIPWWDPRAGQFVLVDQKGGSSRSALFNAKRGLAIDFDTHCVLVDFEGGGGQSFNAGGSRPIPYDAPVEMLVLNADGKLIVHHEKDDTLNEDRVKRVEAWKNRLIAVISKDEKLQKQGTQRGGGPGKGP